MPNQQLTTPEGQPIDPRDFPPQRIAISDLDADGKGTLMLDLTIDAEGRSPVRSIDYRVDGRPIRPLTVFDRPVAGHRETVTLSLAPGQYTFIAEVANELGIRRTMSRDIIVRGVPRPRQARLKVLAIAPSFQEKRIPAIPFAERDVEALRKFFTRSLVSPEGGGAFYPIDEEILEGASATVERVRKSFESLKGEPLGPGDLVVVLIESHFINVDSGRMIVAADGQKIPPRPAIPADELAGHLGAVARRGCKVLVLLDGVHAGPPNVDWDSDISDWVRNLRDVHEVITFVASNSGPSRDLLDQGHRAFAQAVLDSINPPLLKEGPYLLNDFRDIVVEAVLNLTGRQQQAACYVPEAIGGRFPLLNPQAQSSGR